jgi:hypothetical protein
MSVIEAMTMVAGLVYLVLLVLKTGPGWSSRLSLGVLVIAWLAAQMSASGLAWGWWSAVSACFIASSPSRTGRAG